MNYLKLNVKEKKALKELRHRIKLAEIPSSSLDECINIATWNIREFGKRGRQDISIQYIAEVIYQFDIVAITELRDNLSDLQRVMSLLGNHWSVIYSDYISDSGGNKERMAYIFDKRTVNFTGLAAEVDPLRKKQKSGEYTSNVSWWRTPYMASFQSGNFDFVLITAHIRWGAHEKDRLSPLKELATWIDKKVKDKNSIDSDIILLGDFNIPKLDDDLYKAITSKGLCIPHSLRGTSHGSNLEKNKRYDQILHYPRYTKSFSDRGGVLDFFQNDFKSLYPGQKMTKHEFTYQMSDHLPLWCQINIDIEDEVLDQQIGLVDLNAA